MRNAPSPGSRKAMDQGQASDSSEANPTRRLTAHMATGFVKSLIHNILPLSPAFPRFCVDTLVSPSTNSNGIKNLGLGYQKKYDSDIWAGGADLEVLRGGT